MALKLTVILVLCLLAIITNCRGERARYDNYRLYDVVASTEKGLEVLKNLEDTSDSIIFLNGIHNLNRTIKVVVAPHKVPDFLENMGSYEVEYKLLDNNLQNQLDNEVVGSYNPLTRSGVYNWRQYYPLEDTYSWMDQLTILYPGVVTLVEAGESYEGRQILGVEISKSESEKPYIFIEAGIHAREWISSATVTYVINELLTSQRPEIQKIAYNYNWIIVPHANPDGFVYTHTRQRFWRKTRKPYGRCYGADPNRNWGYKWNVVGSSNNPCAETYAGPSAFSEIETRSLAQYVASLKDQIKLYISFHAFSQLLLHPFGDTGTPLANYRDVKQVTDKAVAAIGQRYGTQYIGGSIHNVIYAASGGSIDWIYEILGIKMAFCYELRPSSTASIAGFALPASQILETAEETTDSIVAMVNEVEILGYFR